jgi:RNA polymerase sigma-70 factor (ECF subfamily)
MVERDWRLDQADTHERDPGAEDPLGGALARVARGDEAAFELVYDRVAAPVFGMVRRVVRDPAMSEEVVQEVLLQVWTNASRYNPGRGSAMAWIMTLAHRRSVDRVRAEHAASERQSRVALAEHGSPAHDQVVEAVEISLERTQVRRCLGTLTDLQRESVELAYYGGYTHREVAALVGVPLGTVKTRLRDGLIRLRDCLGVAQ